MSVEVLYSLAEALFPGIRADRAESQKDPFAQFLALKGSNFVSLPSLVGVPPTSFNNSATLSSVAC